MPSFPARCRLAALLIGLALLLAVPGRAVAGAEARCDAALPPPPGTTRPLELTFSGLLPFARDILAHHAVRSRIEEGGRRLRLELHIDAVGEIRLPEGNPATLYLPGRSAAEVLRDPRSRIPDLWRLDEATVLAADIAYDIRLPASDAPAGPPVLDPASAAQLAGYRLVRLYGDDFSGFAAAVFEAEGGGGRAPHRIYAIAGTHVFEHRDFRSWGSGLTFGRAQVTSTAALRMIADAADYARAPGGGEVVLTGQSQGGLVAQGVGYLLQALLDAEGRPHRLAQVVSWGAAGAEEVIARMIGQARRDGGRGLPRDLERHWAASDPAYAGAAAVWATLVRAWRAIPPGGEAASIRATASRMRVLGYFFEVDLFARAGTFPGIALAFPTAMILPGGCDMTVVEALIGTQGGALGVRLESHFLKGYRRAVSRGALAVARPALPAKWPWVLEILPVVEELGLAWLETLYLEGPAASAANWARCLAAPRWQTRGNRSCRESFHAGCAPGGDAGWCLIRDAAPGRPAPLPG
ncbi:hypothetical protein EAH89_18310 [Roseomonas nepalensis]|uniref:Uncharacterized protein n=1 Tax=Muricoccus nepalensis TaxID=1854500 RepID=A0A502FSC0_9PROT|nr:hypothetical protein [Roseomonas nepalensis]TPG52344.1 hypothetical protein EAH89_18310 [Roseomonas nepalensis]